MYDQMNADKPPYHIGVVVLCALLFEVFAPYFSKSLEFGALLFISGFLPVAALAFVCKAICIVCNRPPLPILTHLCGMGWLLFWMLNAFVFGPSAALVEAGLADKLWLQCVGALVGWMASLEFPAPKKRRRRNYTGNPVFQQLHAWLTGMKPEPIPIRVRQR